MATADAGLRRPGWLSRLAQEHARVFFNSIGRLLQNPGGSLLTAFVIGITLALPAGLELMSRNLDALRYSWQGTLQASLFLKDAVDAPRGAALSAQLAKTPGVAKSAYLSREQALEEFRARSGFGGALEQLDSNPLPAVIIVTADPAQPKAQIDQLMQQLAKLPEVEVARLDQQWLERLYAIIELLRRGALLLAGLLALTVLITIGNTIRLDIESRREEILVMKLVGAPNAFIRRPFLYTGLWYGLAGSWVALLLLNAGLLALNGPVRKLAGLYDSDFTLRGPEVPSVLALIGVGMLLGWLGAVWSVARQLSKIEPA